MINWVLFKQTLKSDYKIILIFIGVLTMYFSIISNMYDPKNLDLLNQMASLKLSPELLQAMGFTLKNPSLVGFLSSYFYGLLMLAFPMIYYIIIANKLISSQVDKGSMACILSTPNTRKKVVATQALFLLSTITLLVLFVTILGIIVCSINFPDLLDVKAFILLNLGVLLVHFAISSISFFSSCLFNETKNSLLFGAGVPILFLLIQMLSNVSNILENLKYFTIFTLFNPTDIINGNNILLPFISLIAIALAFYSAAIYVFDKKDLPI